MWAGLYPNFRIRKVILSNFRNISYAEVELPDGKNEDLIKGKPSILGLYGQNGSGKSSLLIAIKALQKALMGWTFEYDEFASCIRSGCEYAKLDFELSAVMNEEYYFDIFYSFCMRIEDKKIRIFDEVLQYAEHSQNSKKANKQIIIDTSDVACKTSGKAFGNKTKYMQFAENREGIDEKFYEAKKRAIDKSASFIFCSDTTSLLYSSKLEPYYTIIRGLEEYGAAGLFVVLMHETTSDTMTLAFWDKLPLDEGIYGDKFILNYGGNCELLETDYKMVESIIPKISSVMGAIIPGMSIEIDDLGMFDQDGNTVVPEYDEEWEVYEVDEWSTYHRFNLVSIRDGVRIPLMDESEGIRRLVSFMSFIIAAYNDPSVTVAIDEIDSGLFEYLLGELLEIMKESAKGQLIFTSHNLRPLEVLPRRNLLFTTSNPKKRFSKLEGISGNNNLRDCYFKQIMHGSAVDGYYNSTDTTGIKKALSDAGPKYRNWKSIHES